MPDPLMAAAELDELLARIGYREDSVIRRLAADVVEGIWAETERTRPFQPRAH